MAIAFKKINAGELKSSAIVPQALDNQWAPSNVLKWLMRHEKPIHNWKDRKRTVLSEWRRSLVYSSQVVINRAYFVNNPVIVDDYSEENTTYFKKLLSQQVIVEYLLTEEAPDQRPAFDIKDENWENYLNIIRDADLTCVRLDWGNQEDDFKNISIVFHQYIQSLNIRDRTDHLSNALKIPQKHQGEFRKRLIEVASFAFDTASQEKNINRNDLYKKFVCVDNSNIVDGIYDKNKPFAAELKEIFDLRYIVNLPDALGRYAFTPKGSPDRSMLGDINQLNLQNLLKDNRINEFIETLKRLHFSKMNEALYLKSLDKLSLSDVIEIRKTDEWQNYSNCLDSLLSDPLHFDDTANNVAKAFSKLNQRITEIKVKNTKKSSQEIVARWQPTMMIIVAIGGALFKFFADSGDTSRIMVEELAGPISVGLAPIAVNLKILANEYVDLGISTNFMRSKVSQGKETWGEIKGGLQKDYKFKFIEPRLKERVTVADQSKNENELNAIV